LAGIGPVAEWRVPSGDKRKAAFQSATQQRELSPT
jgi:hypothetical protein